MTDDPVPHLVQTCAAYQREVALADLDTPPGPAREVRLAEALAHAQEGYGAVTGESLQTLAASEAAPGDLQRLRAWMLELQVRQALLPMQRVLQERQRQAVCLVDEEPIPLLTCFTAMAREPRRARRDAIEAAMTAQLRDLNSLFEAQFKALHTLTEQRGYAAPEALWTEILGTDPAAYEDLARQLLVQTQDVYLDLLTWAVRLRLRIPPGQLRRHDILALFTFPEYQQYYQPEPLISQVQRCVQAMQLDPTADGRLTWRERAPHFGPPVALALEIPDEIVLSYAPGGGLKHAEALASASGRALLWAATSPTVPAVQRLLPDAALSESQAQVFAELLASPRWLHHYSAVSVDRNYTAWRRLDRLYRFRRHLGRFLYSRYLHTTSSLAGAAEAYRDLMMEACGVDYSQEYYLLDWDWQYTALTSLRAWSLAYAQLAALQETFADDWFRNPDAGVWLEQYWQGALATRLEDLRDHFTGTTWDAEVWTNLLLRDEV
ncbi:MAG: hypothetical protein AB7N91_12405 [Candidatus Tectimicrobiota bacterium]